MAPAKLIVFGPTGGIASVASVTARQLGADVVLAMRDPSKAITGLTPELEAKGGFERVQADLSKPETVRAAAEKTGAKHALIYLLHGNQDHMRGPIEALKAAGVEFVVFISSLSVRGVKPHEALANAADNYINKVHAGVESTLAEVYGPKGYVALRPGFFDSNSLRWAAEIRAGGPVTLEFPKVTWDWIAPEDIGRVAAHVATKGPAALADAVGTHGGNHVLLAGPRLISLGDGIRLIAKAAGKPDIEIVALEDVEVAVRHSMEKHHMPEAIARALISPRSLFTDEDMKVGPENVRRLGGGKVTTVEEWAEANKDKFA